MRRSVPVLLILLALGARPGIAQKAGAGLTGQQLLGRQILAQSCAVCHLPAGPDAKTYGPSLNKSTIPEDDDAVRQIILDGNTRMPGFKYFLQPSQIDAIVAYLRTVPPRARPATPAQPKSKVDD
jgi:mono/diheme cytochrome c family protein